MLPVKRAVGAEIEPNSTTSLLLKKPKHSLKIEEGNKVFNLSGNTMEKMDIDEDLHSRQLAVYGRETMRKLFQSNVLVSGINGLGAEVAKNLVLAGVKSITLHDVTTVDLWDLSSNFFASEDDIGKNRAFACVQKLQELNNSVIISTLTESLTKEHLSDFQPNVITFQHPERVANLGCLQHFTRFNAILSYIHTTHQLSLVLANEEFVILHKKNFEQLWLKRSLDLFYGEQNETI